MLIVVFNCWYPGLTCGGGGGLPKSNRFLLFGCVGGGNVVVVLVCGWDGATPPDSSFPGLAFVRRTRPPPRCAMAQCPSVPFGTQVPPNAVEAAEPVGFKAPPETMPPLPGWVWLGTPFPPQRLHLFEGATPQQVAHMFGGGKAPPKLPPFAVAKAPPQKAAPKNPPKAPGGGLGKPPPGVKVEPGSRGQIPFKAVPKVLGADAGAGAPTTFAPPPKVAAAPPKVAAAPKVLLNPWRPIPAPPLAAIQKHPPPPPPPALPAPPPQRGVWP